MLKKCFEKPDCKKNLLRLLGVVVVIVAIVSMLSDGKQVDPLVKLVADFKAETPLPKQVDKLTTLNDLRADVVNRAIVYDMLVEGTHIKDEDSLRKSLKNNVKKMCDPEKSAPVFAAGLHYEWVYYFKEDEKAIAVMLKPEDCPKED